jgi:hypothetical protein
MIPASTSLTSTASGGFLSNELSWSRSCWGRSFEFHRNGQVVGVLERPSFWSSSFLGVTDGGQRWKFRKAGCWGNRAEILDADTERPVAQFKKEWGGPGALTFNDGQTFYLRSSGWWRPVWSLTTASGEPVLDLRPRDKAVQLQPSSSPTIDSRLLLLIMFVLFRVQQVEEEGAAAAVVAAA